MVSGGIRVSSSLMIVALSMLAMPPVNAYQRPGKTRMVSVAANGQDLQHPNDVRSMSYPSVSADARFVAFHTPAQDIVPSGEYSSITFSEAQTVFNVFVHDSRTGKNDIVSERSDDGALLCLPIATQCALGRDPSISADGRYVAFESDALNMVDGDTNLATDIFVRDRKQKETIRVSVSSLGQQANATSSWPSISGNGRFVAFTSTADNLVPDDTNATCPSPVPGVPSPICGGGDVFVHDLETHKTVRVSLDSQGAQTHGQFAVPEISSTGQFVVFASSAEDLVPQDTNRSYDVFIHDREEKITERVSVATDETQSSGNSAGTLGVSADGRYVSFVTPSNNLVPNDKNGGQDIFVRDRKTQSTERVSVTSIGQETRSPTSLPVVGNGGVSYDSSLSASGRYVVFWGDSTFDSDVEDGPDSDVFIYDRRTMAVEMVSVDSQGKPAVDDGPCTDASTQGPCAHSHSAVVSPDGQHVAFLSSATNLDPRHPHSSATPEVTRIYTRDFSSYLGVGALVASAADQTKDSVGRGMIRGSELSELELIARPENGDLLLRLAIEDLASAPLRGTSGLSYTISFLTDNGSYRLRIDPSAALSNSPGGFELLRCKVICDKIADLAGGLGTTGSEAVIGVPLAKVGLLSGGVIANLKAQVSVVGLVEPVTVLDSVAFSRDIAI